MGDGAPRDAPGANAGEDADPGREGGRGAADSGDSSATGRPPPRAGLRALCGHAHVSRSRAPAKRAAAPLRVF
jgi:hypothetical protein